MPALIPVSVALSDYRNIAIPPEWDASPSQVTPQHFTGTHLYFWVERGTVRVQCLAQEHNTMTRPGLEPGPLDPESSALTTRPPRLPRPALGNVRFVMLLVFISLAINVLLLLNRKSSCYSQC